MFYKVNIEFDKLIEKMIDAVDNVVVSNAELLPVADDVAGADENHHYW